MVDRDGDAIGTANQAHQGPVARVDEQLTAAGLDRPIRVVYFGGAFLEYSAVSFCSILVTHPQIELVGGVCQSEGFGLRDRVRETIRRRGALAPLALALHLMHAVVPLLRTPKQALTIRRHARRAIDRLVIVPDIHAPDVLERVRAMDADVGLSYGSPILRPELFNIPRLGTLGIHHGTLPGYRGKKTTFWEVYNGEPVAGLAIQQVSASLDAGDIVMQAEVPIGRRWWWSVDREVHERGIGLYLDAILAVRDGTANPRPQVRTGKLPLYREPGIRDMLRLAGRRIAGPPDPEETSPPRKGAPQ
jgi:folate-dependent phosphoribosylglycinamide formyltransferase PurN